MLAIALAGRPWLVASVRAAELTGAERDRIIEHVRPCWPTGDQALPASTRATIDVVTETDGTVLEATGMATMSSMFSGGYGPPERALGDQAKRAIRDPRCSRLPLPTRLLGHRQSLTLVFAP